MNQPKNSLGIRLRKSGKEWRSRISCSTSGLPGNEVSKVKLTMACKEYSLGMRARIGLVLYKLI